MNVSGPNMPLSIARAYGLAPADRVRVAAPTVEARAGRKIDSAELSGAAAAGIAQAAGKLVAAKVPGGIDFSAAEPAPRAPTLALYSHPADRNVAATKVALGRSLDVTG